MLIAVTGATGFVGRRVLALLPPGVQARALARRPQSPVSGIEWVAGDLDDAAALAMLCDGASAVLHIAGVVNAADEAGFIAGNVRGTQNIVATASAANISRFVQVSSLAAREPALSLYGKSKYLADTAQLAAGLDHVIVRPPGVYGPADTEMLGLFKAARLGIGLAPGGPDARISLVHVDDLARLLIALTAGGPSRVILEVDDGAGARGGYTHADHVAAMAAALERPRPLMIPVGNPILRTAAAVATRIAGWQGKLPTLSRDRAGYLAHPDWVSRGGNEQVAGMWQPQFDLPGGMADTVAGYRQRGWL